MNDTMARGAGAPRERRCDACGHAAQWAANAEAPLKCPACNRSYLDMAAERAKLLAQKKGAAGQHAAPVAASSTPSGPSRKRLPLPVIAGVTLVLGAGITGFMLMTGPVNESQALKICQDSIRSATARPEQAQLASVSPMNDPSDAFYVFSWSASTTPARIVDATGQLSDAIIYCRVDKGRGQIEDLTVNNQQVIGDNVRRAL